MPHSFSDGIIYRGQCYSGGTNKLKWTENIRRDVRENDMKNMMSVCTRTINIHAVERETKRGFVWSRQIQLLYPQTFSIVHLN